MNLFYLIQLFTKQNLILKYRRSYFGLIWGMLNPMFMIFTMSFVFSSIFNINFLDYFLYIFSGMISWYFLNQSIFAASNSFIINEGLLRKVKVAYFVIPFSSVLAVLIDNLLLFFILILLVIIKMGYISPIIFLMIPAYILLTIFNLGISLIVSIFTIYFRDLQWLINIIMQTLFFLTPVLYKPEKLKGLAGQFIEYNPLSYFIFLTNNISAYEVPDARLWFISTLISFVIFIVGIYFYKINKNKLIFRL